MNRHYVTMTDRDVITNDYYVINNYASRIREGIYRGNISTVDLYRRFIRIPILRNKSIPIPVQY